MKFTKEEARKELTAKLTPSVESIGKWERTIKENVETLWSIFGEDSEIELADFVQKALPLFNTTAGFLRKENADLAKSYEEKIQKLSIPTLPVPPANGGDGGNGGGNANEELLKRLKALEDANALQQLALKKEGYKRDVTAKLKEKGVDNDKIIDILLKDMVVDDNFNVDTNVEHYLSMYNALKADFNPNATPKNTGAGNDDYASDTIKAAAALAKQNALI